MHFSPHLVLSEDEEEYRACLPRKCPILCRPGCIAQGTEPHKQ